MMSEQPAATGPLLQVAGDVVLPATTQPFSVRDNFKTTEAVLFSTLWPDFKQPFFGVVEKPMPELRVRKYKLLRIAPDGPIIAELGGESTVEITLAAAFALIKCQGVGEEGFLQTNGFANIFYVRNANGVLCAIRIGWASDGWVVDAIPVADPLAWNGKHEIFCPVPV
jgi:hypothetical protein